MQTYRVRIIRSEYACEREGYKYPEVEKNILDTSSLDEAFDAYNSTTTGIETAKEIIDIETGEVIITDY